MKVSRFRGKSGEFSVYYDPKENAVSVYCDYFDVVLEDLPLKQAIETLQDLIEDLQRALNEAKRLAGVNFK